MIYQFLQGLDLEPVVANRTLPLDQQLRIKEQAVISRNVHSVLSRSVEKGTASALMTAAIKAANLCDHFAALFLGVIMPINNVAVMEVKNAYDLLRNTGYYKKDIKRNAKITMERIDKYDDAVISSMKKIINGDRSQYWMDYTDEHYEYMRHDLDIFYLSVLQVLTKFDEKDREMKARLVTSHALLNYAIGMFDAYFEKIKENHHISIVELYKGARLGFVQSTWSKVVDTICVTHKQTDVEGDKNVRLAFKVIESHLLDLERIAEIMDIAHSYNSDMEVEKYKNPMNTSSQFEKSFEECFKNDTGVIPIKIGV